MSNAQQYLIWLFGTKSTESLVGDSRNVTRFGRILESADGLEYLSTALDPTLDVAYSFTQGATDDLVAALQDARKSLRTVLADLDLKREEPEVAKAAWPVLSAAADIARRLGGETLHRMREQLTDAGGA